MTLRLYSALALAFAVASSPLLSSCLELADTPKEWPCEEDADCADDTHCIANRCRPLSACRSNSDCSAGFVCSEKHCKKVIPPECSQTSAENCLPYACDQNLHCYKSCTGHSHCASGYACKSGVCSKAECSLSTAAEDCNGYACVNLSCSGPSCVESTHCAPGYGCVQSECRELVQLGEACELDEECANGTCCDSEGTGDGVCVMHCRTLLPNASCEFDEECLSGDCSGSICSECTDECEEAACRDVECGYSGTFDCGACSGRAYCSGNVCIAACVGIECGTDNGVDCGTCAEGESCSGSVCVPDACFDAPYVCDGDRVMACQPGFPPQPIAYCDGSEYCRDGHSGCLSYACEPNQGFCEDGVYVPCNSAGRPVVHDERQCESDGRECSDAGCVLELTEMVQTLDPDLVDGQTACGNVFFVEHDVTLTVITQVMGPSTANTIHWFVYEAASEEGPFTQVMSPLADDGYYDLGQIESPRLTIELESGSYYFLGLAAEASTYIIQADAPVPQELSFGNMLFGACSHAGTAATLTADDLDELGTVAQRVTTQTLD